MKNKGVILVLQRSLYFNSFNTELTNILYKCIQNQMNPEVTKFDQGTWLGVKQTVLHTIYLIYTSCDFRKLISFFSSQVDVKTGDPLDASKRHPGNIILTMLVMVYCTKLHNKLKSSEDKKSFNVFIIFALIIFPPYNNFVCN